MTATVGPSAPPAAAPGPPPAAPPGAPRRRRLFAPLALVVALGGFLAWAGSYAMFTSSEFIDDEGDWLIGLKEFRQHGSLYHATWSQCGPFYYDFWSAVLGLAGAPTTTDSGRVATLTVWLLITVVAAVVTLVLTGRTGVALLVETGVFLVMEPLVGEPMEPAGLATLLLVAALAAGTVGTRRWPRGAMWVLGALTAATVLTKVNVGVFLAAGLAVAVLVCGGWRAPGLRHGLAAAVLGGVPVAVCLGLIGRAWVDDYIGLVVLGGAAVAVTVFAARGRPDAAAGTGGERTVTTGDVTRVVGGAAALTAVVVAVALLTGTGLGELVSGALLAQRNLGRVFTAPLVRVPLMIDVAGLAVVVAVAAAVPDLHARFGPALRVGARLVAAAAMIVTCIGGVVVPDSWFRLTNVRFVDAFLQLQPSGHGRLALGVFQYAVAFAWLALRRANPDGTVTVPFERCLLVAVSVLVTLEGYPVAAHQESWGTIGLVVLGGLILGDAATILEARARRPVPVVAARVAASAAVLTLLGLLAATDLTTFVTNYRARAAADVAVRLPGAGLVRLPADQAVADETVTAVLRSHCSTFFGLPGQNSFYLFTGEEPPTGLLTTQWMYLMDTATQRRIVGALTRVRRLCVLYYQPALDAWEEGVKDLPTSSPLVAYLEDGFAPVTDVDGYVVLVRSRAGRAPAAGVARRDPVFRLPVPPSPTVVSTFDN